MTNRNTANSSFWRSKPGHAAIASIAAMVMMIALSSQVQPGAAHAAPITYPAAETGAIAELA